MAGRWLGGGGVLSAKEPTITIVDTTYIDVQFTIKNNHNGPVQIMYEANDGTPDAYGIELAASGSQGDTSEILSIPADQGQFMRVYAYAITETKASSKIVSESTTILTVPVPDITIEDVEADKIVFSIQSNIPADGVTYYYGVDNAQTTQYSIVIDSLGNSGTLNVPNLTHNTSYTLYVRGAYGDTYSISTQNNTQTEELLAPSITEYVAGKTVQTIDVDITNNYSRTVTIVYEHSDSTPDTNSFSLAANGTSRKTVTGLSEATSYTIYAKAVYGTQESSITQITTSTAVILNKYLHTQNPDGDTSHFYYNGIIYDWNRDRFVLWGSENGSSMPNSTFIHVLDKDLNTLMIRSYSNSIQYLAINPGDSYDYYMTSGSNIWSVYGDTLIPKGYGNNIYNTNSWGISCNYGLGYKSDGSGTGYGQHTYVQSNYAITAQAYFNVSGNSLSGGGGCKCYTYGTGGGTGWGQYHWNRTLEQWITTGYEKSVGGGSKWLYFSFWIGKNAFSGKTCYGVNAAVHEYGRGAYLSDDGIGYAVAQVSTGYYVTTYGAETSGYRIYGGSLNVQRMVATNDSVVLFGQDSAVEAGKYNLVIIKLSKDLSSIVNSVSITVNGTTSLTIKDVTIDGYGNYIIAGYKYPDSSDPRGNYYEGFVYKIGSTDLNFLGSSINGEYTVQNVTYSIASYSVSNLGSVGSQYYNIGYNSSGLPSSEDVSGYIETEIGGLS